MTSGQFGHTCLCSTALECLNEDEIFAEYVQNEPPLGKTNNVVCEQVRHKPGCTSTEDG